MLMETPLDRLNAVIEALKVKGVILNQSNIATDLRYESLRNYIRNRKCVRESAAYQKISTGILYLLWGQ